MLTFSPDPQKAEDQMNSVIFFLTTFGYIDGDFDQSEKSYVKKQIEQLVASRVDTAQLEAPVRAELIEKYTRHFTEVFENIDQRVKDLLTEPVAENEEPGVFATARLKQQCFEILKGYDKDGQEQLLSIIDQLISADGEVHPAEVKFRAEMSELLEADLEIEMLEEPSEINRPRLEQAARTGGQVGLSTFFDPLEAHYAKDPNVIVQQLGDDRALLDRAMRSLDLQRADGQGKLAGHQKVTDFAGQKPFLDGHVYVLPTQPGKSYELLVFGDLHGCYSVLKAGVLQFNFFEKLEAYRRDPKNNPSPHIVFLGDYIDRGLFSLNGVLRTVLQLYVTAPDHVHVLRGNHEYYIEHEGKIYGGVKPAEAINTLKPHVPMDIFRQYMKLFESLPNMMFFDRMMFVHGGIPRDRDVKAKWLDLSTLNDKELRFEMMWSDPAQADVIPAILQEKTVRFSFGKQQFRAFMQRIGCHTMIRGHEKVNAGFAPLYNGEEGTLLTLFSAGGRDNEDLPRSSGYRSVTPMVLTVKHGAQGVSMQPWPPDYKMFNDPAHNGFFRVPPEIEHKAD